MSPGGSVLEGLCYFRRLGSYANHRSPDEFHTFCGSLTGEVGDCGQLVYGTFNDYVLKEVVAEVIIGSEFDFCGIIGFVVRIIEERDDILEDYHH